MLGKSTCLSVHPHLLKSQKESWDGQYSTLKLSFPSLHEIMIQGQNQDWGRVRTTSKSKISTQHIRNLLQNARGLYLVPWTFSSWAMTARLQGSNLKLVKSGRFPPPLLKQQTPSPAILPGRLHQFTSSHQVGRRGTQTLLYRTPAAKRLFCSGLSALPHLHVSLQTCCIPSFPLPTAPPLPWVLRMPGSGCSLLC